MTAQTTTYFWLVAVALAGGRMANSNGKVDAAPGATQEQIYQSTRRVLDSQYGADQYVITHYSVMPDQL